MKLSVSAFVNTDNKSLAIYLPNVIHLLRIMTSYFEQVNVTVRLSMYLLQLLNVTEYIFKIGIHKMIKLIGL